MYYLNQHEYDRTFKHYQNIEKRTHARTHIHTHGGGVVIGRIPGEPNKCFVAARLITAG